MPSDTKTVRERIEEALREIGVLLLAFAPVDATVNAPRGLGIGFLLLFGGLGLCLLTVALHLERLRREVRRE